MPEALSSMSARELVRQWWSEAWTDGLWAAPWSKSLNDLTAEQAAWVPPSAPGVGTSRHSIWQIVEHLIFWRESWLRRAATGQKPTKEEVAAGNFPPVRDATPAAWCGTLRRFEDSQQRLAEALKDPRPESDPLAYFLPHDCYHFGQINAIRGMLGLAPIE